MTFPKIIVCDGWARSQRAWARELGQKTHDNEDIVRQRIKRGWPECKAATMPVKRPSREIIMKRREQLRLQRYLLIGKKFIRSKRSLRLAPINLKGTP